MTIRRTITVEIHTDNTFTVRDGGEWCPRLGWDEMLGTVAELTHPQVGRCRYRMADAAAHREYADRWNSDPTAIS